MAQEEVKVSDISRDSMAKDSIVPLVDSYLHSIPEYDDFYTTHLTIAKQIRENGSEVSYSEERMKSGDAMMFAHFMSIYGFFRRGDKEHQFEGHHIYEMTERGRVLKRCGSIQRFVEKEIADEAHEKWVKETTNKTLEVQLKNARWQSGWGKLLTIIAVLVSLTNIGVTVALTYWVNKTKKPPINEIHNHILIPEPKTKPYNQTNIEEARQNNKPKK